MKLMKIAGQGFVHRGEPGGERAIATFPSVTVLEDGSLLAVYRVGPGKESDGSVTQLRRSTDGGLTWGPPAAPFSDIVNGVRGSLQVVYITPLEPGRLMACTLWVNREAFPGKPLFNPETEGCLPMDILIAESRDRGVSWTAWRKVAVTSDVGPASLTNPLLRFPGGRLAISIETNKHYYDPSTWYQRVVYVDSDDGGESWSFPRTTCQDPSGTLFYWDQRAAISKDGILGTFSWTYHKKENRYLNVSRRLSPDGGRTWTGPEDLGFADQPSHPAVLNDGAVVLAWVDRYGTQSIRARLAERIDAPFDAETEVVIYEAARQANATGTTGEMLSDMARWSFGLPYAETLPSGDVLVVYYAGDSAAMDIRWARLTTSRT